MPDVDAAARIALSDVITPLVEAHGGAQAVATQVGVHKTRVYDWMKGLIPLAQVGTLAAKLGVDITVTFAAGGEVVATRKEPPPEWARALEDRLVLEIQLNREMIAAPDPNPEQTARIEALRARLDALAPGEPLPAESRPRADRDTADT